MKNLMISMVIVASSLSVFAGEKLKTTDDVMVPATMVDSMQTVSAGHHDDAELVARVLTVYIGAAAGYDRVILTLLDSGEVQGDYANTYSYDLGYITGAITDLKLISQPSTTSNKLYLLTYTATTQIMNEDGEFKDADASQKLLIRLDKDGNLISVTDAK